MSRVRQKIRETEINSEGVDEANKSRAVLLGGLLLIVLLGIGLMIFLGMGGGRATAPTGVYEGVAINGRVLGNPDAPLLIRDFSDFNCPHCRSAAVGLTPEIIKTYVVSGQARLEFIPVAVLENSEVPATASLCAEDQGQFWIYQEKLFDRQGQERFDIEQLIKYADELGLDAQTFRDCMLSGKHASTLNANNQEFHRVGASGTPTFIVGDELVAGAVPFAEIQQVIEKELNP
ncbi:MAG: thioredoxin domain-containing protein [Ardenticatenales bacterium]|nr:thioredoxin domain-containing protein [Ardenticatenales bacterium]